MSRIGRKPISVPSGVEVKLDDHVITVKGPKGTLTRELHKDMIIEQNANEIEIKRPSEAKTHKSLQNRVKTLS